MLSKITTILMLVSCAVCVMGLSQTVTPITPLLADSLSLVPKDTGINFESFLTPLLSVLTGMSLATALFFFLLKRMIIQYDKKHEKYDENITNIQDTMYSFKENLQSDIHDFETNLTTKHHEQSENLHREIRDVLNLTTKAIIDNLESLRETIQEMVEDIANLKGKHNNCDYNSGDIRVMKNKLDTFTDMLKRIENSQTKKKL